MVDKDDQQKLEKVRELELLVLRRYCTVMNCIYVCMT